MRTSVCTNVNGIVIVLYVVDDRIVERFFFPSENFVLFLVGNKYLFLGWRDLFS